VGGSFQHIRQSEHMWAEQLTGRNSCLVPATATGDPVAGA
jgi:hypothetical protein